MRGVALDGGSPLLDFGQEMRRGRRGDSLRRKVTADVQVSRVLFFLDRLMLLARLFDFLLLGARALVQRAVARFEFAADTRDVFLRLCEASLSRL